MIEALTNRYMAMQQSRVQQDASTAVLKSSIDMAARQGDNVERLIQSAGAAALPASVAGLPASAITDPALGRNVDISV